ncbi:YbdD/YjiX family protein [Cellulomonas sp. URHB0016]
MSTVRRGGAGRGRALARRLARPPARAGRAVHWYVTALLGDQDYARYVAHVERLHPGSTPVSEATYWRERHAEQDAHPGARCC